MSVSSINAAPSFATARPAAAPAANATGASQPAAQTAPVKDADGDYDSSPSSPAATSSSAVLTALSTLKAGG